MFSGIYGRLRHKPVTPLFLLGLLRNSDQPVHCDCAEDVEDNENPQVGEIVPSLVVKGVDVRQEDVSVFKGTKAALRCGVLGSSL